MFEIILYYAGKKKTKEFTKEAEARGCFKSMREEQEKFVELGAVLTDVSETEFTVSVDDNIRMKTIMNF